MRSLTLSREISDISGPIHGEWPPSRPDLHRVRGVAVALITGAARANSIAAGISSRLRDVGWEVVTNDLEDCDYPCDLSTHDGPDHLIDAVRRDHGTISALILCHAHDIQSSLLDTTPESFDAHVAVNARASLLLIAAFARQAGPEGGAVVAFTSDHTTGNLPYGASKGALDRIVISAARDLGPAGISANVVNPGPIDTGWMDGPTRERLAAATPMGRLGTPADIAPVVDFLISPQGRWISGQLINADGAFSAQF